MTERVRLMLDEMFPPSIADTLSKDQAIDVVAVSGDPVPRTPGGALKIADTLLAHAERERILGQGAADWLTSI